MAAAALALVVLADRAHAAEAQAILREAFQRTMSRPIRFEGSLVRFDPNERVTQRSRWRFERTGPPGEGRVKITILGPEELKGVKLLIRSSPDGLSEEWLYTPAADRIRSVRPDARGRRFYSTDFTFDDLQEANAGLLSSKLAGEQDAAGERCWRIEARMRAGSPYDEKVFFVSQEKGVIVQADHLLDSSRVKRMIYRSFQNHGDIWLPGQIDAVDIETGSRTVFVLEESQLDVVFREDEFEPQSLGLP